MWGSPNIARDVKDHDSQVTKFFRVQPTKGDDFGRNDVGDVLCQDPLFWKGSRRFWHTEPSLLFVGHP